MQVPTQVQPQLQTLHPVEIRLLLSLQFPAVPLPQKLQRDQPNAHERRKDHPAIEVLLQQTRQNRNRRKAHTDIERPN